MKRWLGISSVMVASVLMVLAASLHSAVRAQDADALVKQRLAIMKGVSDTLKALDKSAKEGKVGSGDAAAATKALAEFQKFPGLFPPGTGSDKIKTRAKPEIWQEWPKFEEQAGKLTAALAEVQKAAASGDAAALGSTVKAAQGVCGGCHKPFRGPRP